MVGTILPIGYGERRRNGPALAPWMYAAGAMASAVAFGAVVALVGAAIRAIAPVDHIESLRGAVAAAVAAVYAAREAGVVSVPVPQLQRQVPQWWRRTLPPRVAALAYGLALGPGVGTYVMTGAFYVVLVWCLLSGDVGLGAVLMSLYALGKAAPLLGLGTRGAEAVWTLSGAAERIALLEPVMRRLVFVSLAAVSLLLILHAVNGGQDL